MKHVILILSLFLSFSTFAKKSAQPNVLIILADDLGWGDVGFNGCTDIPTPNLDKLASDGVIFSQGYATHMYCGPSRAGLLTGRPQQRFGCENNLNKLLKGPNGIPASETLLSEVFHDNGYTTCAIGKWHLGDSAQFWPINNGFDNWFGFTGGARNYWGKKPEKNYSSWHCIYHDGIPEPLENLGYLTDDFTNAAVNYIDDYSKSKKPFLMYLAYNAPHAPIQATREYLDKTEHIEDGRRAAYGAMVAGMDAGVGKVIAQLKATGEYDNTLIFFYSDNGGHGNGTSQAPYRGQKGMLFEGGIRVPFSMTWAKSLDGNQVYKKPIVAFDVFATAIKAAGIDFDGANQLAGVDLLPYVKGDNVARPHNELFWRYSEGLGYAARIGDYKLVKEAVRDDLFLFDMANDSLEQHNIIAENPEMVKKLQAAYANWNKNNVKNLWPDAHPENVLKTKKTREAIIRSTCSGEDK